MPWEAGRGRVHVQRCAIPLRRSEISSHSLHPPSRKSAKPDMPCRLPCRGGRRRLRAGALGGVGCSCRGAAATAAVKPPLATPPACASHAHGRHRLPIGHDTGLARAVRTLPRDLRARSVGGMSVLHFGGLQCWALIMFRSSCGLVRGIAHSNPFSPLGSRLGVGRGGLHSQ